MVKYIPVLAGSRSGFRSAKRCTILSRARVHINHVILARFINCLLIRKTKSRTFLGPNQLGVGVMRKLSQIHRRILARILALNNESICDIVGRKSAQSRVITQNAVHCFRVFSKNLVLTCATVERFSVAFFILLVKSFKLLCMSAKS